MDIFAFIMMIINKIIAWFKPKPPEPVATTTVSGKVTCDNVESINQVLVMRLENDTACGLTLTDEQGRFVLYDVPYGPQLFYAMRDAEDNKWLEGRVTFSIADGTEVIIPLTLTPEEEE